MMQNVANSLGLDTKYIYAEMHTNECKARRSEYLDRTGFCSYDSVA